MAAGVRHHRRGDGKRGQPPRGGGSCCRRRRRCRRPRRRGRGRGVHRTGGGDAGAQGRGRARAWAGSVWGGGDGELSRGSGRDASGVGRGGQEGRTAEKEGGVGGSARREPNAKHGRASGRLRWWGRRIRMDAAVAITDAPLRLPRGVSHRRGRTALDLGCVVEAATWPRHPLLTGKAKCTSSDQVEDEKPPFSLKIPGRVPDCPNAVAPYRERVLARPCYRPVCLSSWSRRPGVGHAWQFRCSGSSCRSRAPRLPSLHAPS